MVFPTGLVRWTLLGWTSSGTNESRESVEHFAISYHSRLARATKSHDRLQVFDSLPALFERSAARSSRRLEDQIGQLKDQLARKDEVIAEITADYIAAKKKSGER